MSLAENLRYARQEKGLTLTAVAEELGMAPSALSRYENGRSEPALSKLELLAAHYGCSVSQLRGPSLQGLAKAGLQPVAAPTMANEPPGTPRQQQPREAPTSASDTADGEVPVQVMVSLTSSEESLERALNQLQQVYRWLCGGGDITDKKGLHVLVPLP